MTQKFSQPQGSSPFKGDKQYQKKITPALLFSAFLVAVSFLVMLIPLAIFNVSQVAAILGKRVAFCLLFFVAFLFILLGKIMGDGLTVTGIFVLFVTPFFIAAITIREKKYHWFYAAAVLFIPIILTFSYLLQVNREQLYDGAYKLQKILVSINTPASKVSVEPENQDTTREVAENLIQQAFKTENPNIIKDINEGLEYSSWQRLLHFIFGAGASLLLLFLLISFANVVFVDFGFEQIERLRAIVNYVRKNPNSLSSQMTLALFALPMVRANRLQTPIEITNHLSQSVDGSAQTVNSSNKKLFGFLSIIWKPLKPKNVIVWQGYTFLFNGQSPWRLRDFSLPFPIVCLAIAVLGGVGFWYGNIDDILSSFQGRFTPIIAIASLLSFITITIVALQGMFTIYKRVSTFFVLMLMLIFVCFVSKISIFSPFIILAIFGSIGLLDYIYDWRGRKAV